MERHVRQPLAAQLATGVAADDAGNATIVGSHLGDITFGSTTHMTQGGHDAFVTQFGPSGTVAWTQSHGATGNQIARAIAVDGDRNLIIAGEFAESLDFGGGMLSATSEADMFLAKLSVDGAHIWSRAVGTAQSMIATSIAVGADQSIAVVGYFSGNFALGNTQLESSGGEDGFIACFDPLGELLWAKAFGNFNDQRIWRVSIDHSLSVIVAGEFTGSIDLGGGALSSAGGKDGFVAKLAADGTHLWSLKYGNSGPEQWVRALAVDTNDNIIGAGPFDGTVSLGTETHMSSEGLAALVFKLAP